MAGTRCNCIPTSATNGKSCSYGKRLIYAIASRWAVSAARHGSQGGRERESKRGRTDKKLNSLQISTTFCVRVRVGVSVGLYVCVSVREGAASMLLLLFRFDMWSNFIIIGNEDFITILNKHSIKFNHYECGTHTSPFCIFFYIFIIILPYLMNVQMVTF